jgi:hypothetical protein
MKNLNHWSVLLVEVKRWDILYNNYKKLTDKIKCHNVLEMSLFKPLYNFIFRRYFPNTFYLIID